MWAAPEEGGFLTADLEEMNWHTLAVDPRTPQQTLTVNQRKDKGRHFLFFIFVVLLFLREQTLQLLRFRPECYFIPCCN